MHTYFFNQNRHAEGEVPFAAGTRGGGGVVHSYQGGGMALEEGWDIPGSTPGLRQRLWHPGVALAGLAVL